MAWERVAGGPIGNGDRFEIDRCGFSVAVRRASATRPFRLRTFRWRLIRADGSESVQATAPTREKIDAAVGAYRSGVADIPYLAGAQPTVENSAPEQDGTGRSGPGLGSGGSSNR